MQQAGANYQIEFTRAPGHATQIATEAAQAGQYNTVVSVGGDGTLNEVARALVHTNTQLGLIPAGSGNGLVRHLGISLNIDKAIQNLINGQPTPMDAGQINGRYFFVTFGLGFDAVVAHAFDKEETRGLKTYIKAGTRAFFKYKPANLTITNKDTGTQHTENAFLTTIANANQFGNNAFIAPKASLADGKLDVCLLKPVPLWAVPQTMFRLFTKKIYASAYYKGYQTEALTIQTEMPLKAHMDGEPIRPETTIEIKVIKNAIKVIAPLKPN